MAVLFDDTITVAGGTVEVTPWTAVDNQDINADVVVHPGKSLDIWLQYTDDPEGEPNELLDVLEPAQGPPGTWRVRALNVAPDGAYVRVYAENYPNDPTVDLAIRLETAD